MHLDAFAAAELGFIREWEDAWGPFEQHASKFVDPDTLRAAWRAYAGRLAGNYPFFHPRYAGQMLKPPHPVAVAGYLAAMWINPNNHALDGGPPTSHMEKEVVRDLAAMFGLPGDALGHLTSSGTIANLEALWVARQTHPGKKIAFSADAHYTHSRMGEVLGIETVTIPTDAGGHLDLNALEATLRAGDIGTVVLTAGTTGLGVVDPIHDALALREKYGVRLHVDAAYGGFFTLLVDSPDAPPDFPAKDFRAIRECDSVVVDPHKHGLQPYGCGCVLFRDPAAGQFYKHDSPYTYFTSDELHLGEISLECSRAGAAAGALWLTLKCLPLTAEGLGGVLAATLRAARTWRDLIEASDELTLLIPPELDIVTFFPSPPRNASDVDAASQRLFHTLMHDPNDPIYLSVLRVDADRLHALHPQIVPDVPQARIVRSVLMKPEHEEYVAHLHERTVGVLEERRERREESQEIANEREAQ